MGCIARLGCLGLLCIVALVGWITRDRWLTVIGHTSTTGTSATVTNGSGVVTFAWSINSSTKNSAATRCMLPICSGVTFSIGAGA